MDGEPFRNEYLTSSQWSGTAPGSINYTGGNVGIGTASPGYLLDVFGIVRAGNPVSASIYLTNSEVKWRGDGTAHFSIFNQNSTLQIRNTSGNFEPGTAGSNLVTINTSGNVGIGTTNPGYKLETSGGAIAVTGTSDYLYYAVTNSTGSGCYMMFDAQTAGGSGRKYQIGSTGTGNNPGTGCFELYDATGSATRLVVKASGNVGIGTTNPGQTLDVNGSIQTNGSIFMTGQGSTAIIILTEMVLVVLTE